MRIPYVVAALMLAIVLKAQEPATAPLYDGRMPLVVELAERDPLTFVMPASCPSHSPRSPGRNAKVWSTPPPN